MLKRSHFIAVAGLVILADLASWIFMMTPSVDAKGVLQDTVITGQTFPCQGTPSDPCTGVCLTSDLTNSVGAKCPGTAYDNYQNSLAINTTGDGNGSVSQVKPSPNCYQYGACQTGNFAQNEACPAKYGKGNCTSKGVPPGLYSCAQCSKPALKWKTRTQFQNGGSEG